ncbi:MAG: hypothetical protein DHS20C11_15800 [Lysobacteraceae bacterium]|nr:MAG: hypothetical protein DHS20C11_15800 [Xanthomonadaceae bacterium]
MLIACYGAPYSGMISDGVRDLNFALSIANDGQWVLKGPWMSGVGHALGPAWFYWLALPLSLHADWLGVVLFNVVCSSLMYPMAYLCGRAWGGRSCGLLAAALLAWPNWSHLNQLFLSHTDLVITLTLATCWLLKIWLDRPRLRTALAVGLSAGLAFHAHPSSAGLVVLIGITCLVGRRDWPMFVRHGLAAAFAFLLPWLPRTFVGDSLQAIDMTTFSQTSEMAGRLLLVPEVMSAGSWFGGAQIIDFLWSIGPLWLASLVSGVFILGLALIVTTAVLGAPARFASDTRCFTLLVTAWLAVLVVATVLKHPMSFYGVFAWIGTSALLLAFMASACSHQTLRWVPALALVLGLAGQSATTSALFRIAHQGSVQVPSLVSDITANSGHANEPSWYLSTIDYRRFAQWQCAQADPPVLLGALGAAIDISGGLERRIACGSSAYTPRLSGRSNTVVAGFPTAWAESLHLLGQSTLGHLTLFEPLQRFGSFDVDVVLHDPATYPPYVDARPGITTDIDIHLPADQTLLIANPRHHFLPTTSWTVSGDQVATLVQQRRISVHRCTLDDCSITVSISAPRPELIQLFTVRHRHE